ncbi:MAG: CpsD/CapB family tyrosine-protein kinase [Deltaproteobacteria bacterium]|nr:CpsD/CapB family tyrosine-protein kinase [Deltaproteobacteria bacterium]
MALPVFLRKIVHGVDSPPCELPGGKHGDVIFNEQFKALRAKFEYKLDMMKLKVVAVTSAIAGEGKTTTCINLATNLVAAGRRKVLLIDLDLRKSDLARTMNISPLPGMSEYLQGTVSVKDIMRNGGVPGLYVIPSGMKATVAAELLTGDRFRAFLKDISGHFDVVLLDTPPIVPVADTLGLQDQVDGFVFIYRIGLTPHQLFANAIEDIGANKVVGVVLNGVEPKRQKYYERYYGKYYKKADGEEAPV